MPLPKTYEELDQRTRALGEYLAASEFGGKPWTAQIQDSSIVSAEDDEGHPCEKQTLVLVRAQGFPEPPWGTKRSALVNQSNRQLLRAMFGSDPNAVIGKRVTLFPTKTRMKGAPVDCWRVAGSPDLERDLQTEIHLPRRKPIQVKLVKTGAKRESGED
jgi:hypothetical protein